VKTYRGPACPRCRKAVDPETLSDGLVLCPHCGRDFEARVFHPPQRNARVLQLAQMGPEGAGACANHPRNAAVTSCDRCGVFICGLCELSVDGTKYCPACFDRLAQEGAIASAQVRFRDYASLAIISSFFGIITVVLSFPLGFLGLYYVAKGIRARKDSGASPGSLLIALFVALGAVLLGVVLIIGVLASRTK
jgi:ribosomal protein L37AE/L43A